MSVSYNKLWKMLIDQKMSHIELQRAAPDLYKRTQLITYKMSRITVKLRSLVGVIGTIYC